MSRFVLRLAASASAIALFPFGFAAAQTEPESVAEVGVIVVTAQRRSESIREVPFAVTALNGASVTAPFDGGGDILQLAGRVPGLYAESSNGRYAPRFYIRGLGNVDFDFNASQPVSVVLDEVVLENVYLKGFPLFDVQQVEVLRGPQGTLFGRNTPAGVIKIDTVKPGQDFEGFGSVSLGTYFSRKVEAGVTVPVSDTLSFRLSGLYNRRDDWVDNTNQNTSFAKDNGDDLGNFTDEAVRLHVAWRPTERLSTLLTLQNRDFDGTGTINRANVLTTGSNELNARFDRERVFYDGGRNNFNTQDSSSVALRADYDLGPATLTGIVARYNGDSSGDGDIDGGVTGTTPQSGFIPFASETGTLSSDLRQDTYEVRLASNGRGRFGWLIGAFAWDERFNLVSATFNGTGNPNPTIITDVVQESQSWSVFGQARYDLTEAFTLTGGLRYTDDEREFDGARVRGPALTIARDVADEQVSWDVSALYRLNDQVNLFARVARGYRGPSIQGRIATANVVTVADSETVLSYETGFKARLLDGRARFNATAFHYTVDDQQFTAIGGEGNFNQLINADRGVGQGFEIDGDVALFEGLTVSGGLSYTDTEIQDDDLLVAFCGAPCTVTDPIVQIGTTRRARIDGNPFPQAPKWTGNLVVDYRRPVSGDGEIFVTVDGVMQKDFNLFLYQSVEFQQDEAFEIGLRAGYRDQAQGFEAAVFARNLTDEENVIGAIDFNNLTAFVNEPRIVGVEVSKAF